MRKLVVTFVAALALAVPALAAAATPTFEARTFVTTPGALSDVGLDLTIDTNNAAPARIVIYVPQGYGLNTGVAAGTTVGTIDAVASVGGSNLAIPTGNIVSDNPASYTANACAPGAHAAVWVAKAGNFAIPIYVDPTAGAETSLGAFKLVTCLLSPYIPESAGGAPSGVRLAEAELDFVKTELTNPSPTAFYLWRVLVTPYTVGAGTPNAAGTYELRSGVFIPATLTIKKGSYSKKTKRVVLTGKLTLLGKAIRGVPVLVFTVSSSGDVKQVGSAKTNKKGIYSLKLKVTKTTTFSALVFGPSGSCDATPASPAPAGCAGETDTSIFANFVKVVVK